MKKRIGILTAGGDCPGLNAAIRGVVRASYHMFDAEIIGIRDGYRGLIEGDYGLMEKSQFSNILTRGGTILGTTKSRHCWLSGVTEPCPLPQNFPLLAYHWWGFPKPSITM